MLKILKEILVQFFRDISFFRLFFHLEKFRSILFEFNGQILRFLMRKNCFCVRVYVLRASWT